MMEHDKPAIAPALMLQITVVVLGGLAIYYSTVSEFRVAIAESKTNRAELGARVSKLEAFADTCVVSKFREESHEKDINELNNRFKEFDERLREHETDTKKLLPLGKRSAIEPFRIN